MLSSLSLFVGNTDKRARTCAAPPVCFSFSLLPSFFFFFLLLLFLRFVFLFSFFPFLVSSDSIATMRIPFYSLYVSGWSIASCRASTLHICERSGRALVVPANEARTSYSITSTLIDTGGRGHRWCSMRALSRNDAVPRANARKRGGLGEDSDKIPKGLHYQIVGGAKNRERVRSRYTASSRFVRLLHFASGASLVAPLLSPSSRASPLSSSTSTSRFPTRNVVSGRTSTTTTTSSPLFSLSLYVLIYIYLRPVSSCRESWRKRTSRHSGEKNASEISFAGQFIGEKAMPGYR